MLKRNPIPRLFLPALGLLYILVLAGCPGNNSPSAPANTPVPTLSLSVTPTATPSLTPTQTACVTPTSTPTATLTPLVCPGSGLIGNMTFSRTDSIDDQGTVASRYGISSGARIDQLIVYGLNGLGTNSLGLYADNGDGSYPTGLLASVNYTDNLGLAGPITASISPVSVTAGYVWLAISGTTPIGHLIYFGTGGGVNVFDSGESMPAVFNVSNTVLDYASLSAHWICP